MLILLIHQHVLSPVMHAKAIPLLKIKELYSSTESEKFKSYIDKK